MLFITIANQYLYYLEHDRGFKDIRKRSQRVGYLIQAWHDKRIEDLTHADVSDFIKSLRSRNCSPGYINIFIFIIRHILTFANDRGFKTFEPKSIKPLPVPKKAIFYLTKNQTIDILNFLDGQHLFHRRNKAITAAIVDTGARISEVLSLNRSDWAEIRKGKKLIRGKFSKERPLFFTWSKPFIQSYLKTRHDAHPALFITHCRDYRWKAQRLLPDGFRKYLREADKSLDFHVSPHILRKTALNTWKENGMELKAVSLIAGHESVMTTERFYLGVDWNQLQAVHKKFSYI